MKKAEFIEIYSVCKDSLNKDECMDITYKFLTNLFEQQLIDSKFLKTISDEDNDLDEIINMLLEDNCVEEDDIYYDEE